MLKKFGRKLVDNIGLKLLAIIFAVALWMVVVSINDPTIRRAGTVSVTLQNQEYLTEMGKYSDILSENNTVTFFYSTNKSTYENLSSSDFSARADMEKIEYNAANGTWRVPVVVIPTKYVSKINIESKDIYLDVTLEDSSNKQFFIKAVANGTVADGCALGDVEINDRNVVQVSGPASVVGMIDSVVAAINVEGMSSDITDDVVLEYRDKDGNEIDTTKLRVSVKTVGIRAQILGTKDVALEFSTSGDTADGYRVKGITNIPQQVRVKGKTADLNMLDKIVIPTEVLDLTDVTENIEKVVDISAYLPKGISLVINGEAKVNVSIEIEPIETKVFRVPVNNLVLNGLGSNYVASYEEDYVDITVTAGKSQLAELTGASITGVIEAHNLGVGTYTVNVAFDLDPEIYTVAELTIELEIERHGNGTGAASSDRVISRKDEL